MGFGDDSFLKGQQPIDLFKIDEIGEVSEEGSGTGKKSGGKYTVSKPSPKKPGAKKEVKKELSQPAKTKKDTSAAGQAYGSKKKDDAPIHNLGQHGSDRKRENRP